MGKDVVVGFEEGGLCLKSWESVFTRLGLG